MKNPIALIIASGYAPPPPPPGGAYAPPPAAPDPYAPQPQYQQPPQYQAQPPPYGAPPPGQPMMMPPPGAPMMMPPPGMVMAPPPPPTLPWAPGPALGLVGGILALLGALLPWVTATYSTVLGISLSVSLSGLSTWQGDVAMIMGILCLVFCALRKRMMLLTGGIMGALAMVMAIIGLVQVNSYSGSLNVVGNSFSIGPGFGIYLTIVGGILGLVGGLLGFMKAKSMNLP